ncbi:DNA glycosylase [Coniochaeta hoffmannii]|uniref:DNA glycosylase n=1 Tax=Coniochaeta hoffmannii TaxID=91930 RepID=A0AA38VE15_9PEZI|nr:DNA glycosylase [Coniochaeta hoffmannii]
MSTRRITRSATGALKERDKNTPAVTIHDANSAPTKKRTASTKAESAPKRMKAALSAAKPAKAATKPKATIVKRGWALPHGMGSGELTAENNGTSSGDAGQASSSTAAVQPLVENNTSLRQADEINDTPIPDNVDISDSKVVTEPPATEVCSAEQPKRLKRQATKHINYAEDTPIPDNADITAIVVPLASTAGKADTPEVSKRPTRRAAKTVKSEDAVESSASMAENIDSETNKADPDFKPRNKRGTTNKYGLTRGYSPYPHRTVPTPEQCEEVHRILVETHGAVIQPRKVPPPSITVAGCGETRSVLDALLRTRISANTLMDNADRAVEQLAKTYGIAQYGVGTGSIDWNAVRLGSMEKLTQAIRVAGTAKLKAGHIKTILDMVHDEQKARAHALVDGVPIPGAENEDDGQKALEVMKAVDDYLSLEHMRAMTTDEAIDEFVKYPGIAVKTAACVILFCLQMPCFAVDTHVHKMCKWLGWVPEKANETDTFNHGEHMVPDHLKYALHQLFIRHGQDCFKCRKNTKPGTKAWDKAPECPLEHLLVRNKTMAKGSEDEGEEEEASGGEGKAEGPTKKKPKRAKGKKKASKVETEEEAAAGGEEGAKNDTKHKPKRSRGKKTGSKADEVEEEALQRIDGH